MSALPFLTCLAVALLGAQIQIALTDAGIPYLAGPIVLVCGIAETCIVLLFLT